MKTPANNTRPAVALTELIKPRKEGVNLHELTSLCEPFNRSSCPSFADSCTAGFTSTDQEEDILL